MSKVFISHASTDRDAVMREVVELLRRHGIDVWFAQDDIAAASSWERSLLDGLKGCEWFLIVLTPRAVKSAWVKAEVDWAIEHRPQRIVPVLMEDCDAWDLHMRLPGFQFVDFRKEDEAARRLLLRCWDVEYRPAALLRSYPLGDRYIVGELTSGRDFLTEYIGKDKVLNRSVLIKRTPDDIGLRDGELNPVVTEVEATAAFVHPAIPRVFDLAVDPELGTYSVLEHIPGVSLRTRMAEPLSPTDVVKLMIPLCDAVDYANTRGVIHRNIKPGSIVCGENGGPFLTNFIIARLASGKTEPVGQVVGTPAYMAPEQCTGDPVDRRTDVWGLGVLFYQLLTEKLPFSRSDLRETAVNIRDSILKGTPTPPREVNRSIPMALEEICLKCLQRVPEDRYSSAAEMGLALSSHQSDGLMR